MQIKRHISLWFPFLFCLICVGAIGVLWSIGWFWFIFETPAVHPRISPEERKEIEDAIGSTNAKHKPTYVPWRSILTSPCVWAIIITHGTSVFGYFTITNQLPTYMKTILHYDIKSVSKFPFNEQTDDCTMYISFFVVFLVCLFNLIKSQWGNKYGKKN